MFISRTFSQTQTSDADDPEYNLLLFHIFLNVYFSFFIIIIILSLLHMPYTCTS